MGAPDVRLWFDPVCPFAWMTSKWVRRVAALRGYDVDWRFIALRLVNADVDYASRFPEGYEEGHTAGRRLLRVAAAVRAEHGPVAVGAYYEALGNRIWEVAGGASPKDLDATRALALAALADVALPDTLADALVDEAYDEELQRDTDEALALTGKDVGTPIIQVGASGPGFFGPVISRLPDDAQAVELWDHVAALAAFPGFAELKRSLREIPQLPAFGVVDSGVEQDWQGGRRTA
jgi:hypothetical protein